MAEFLNPKDLQTAKDVRDAIENIKKLRSQMSKPNRYGMIEALSNAKAKAPLEITTIELVQFKIGVPAKLRGYSENDYFD